MLGAPSFFLVLDTPLRSSARGETASEREVEVRMAWLLVLVGLRAATRALLPVTFAALRPVTRWWTLCMSGCMYGRTDEWD